MGKEFILSRDELRQSLSEHGVGSAIYYPLPICRQPLYQKLGYDDNLPVSEKAAQEVLSLPVRPDLRQEELDYIVESILSCARQ